MRTIYPTMLVGQLGSATGSDVTSNRIKRTQELFSLLLQEYEVPQGPDVVEVEARCIRRYTRGQSELPDMFQWVTTRLKPNSECEGVGYLPHRDRVPILLDIKRPLREVEETLDIRVNGVKRNLTSRKKKKKKTKRGKHLEQQASTPRPRERPPDQIDKCESLTIEGSDSGFSNGNGNEESLKAKGGFDGITTSEICELNIDAGKQRANEGIGVKELVSDTDLNTKRKAGDGIGEKTTPEVSDADLKIKLRGYEDFDIFRLRDSDAKDSLQEPYERTAEDAVMEMAAFLRTQDADTDYFADPKHR